MADSPSTATRDYRGVEGQVDDADNAAPVEATTPKAPVRRTNGVTTANVAKTERPPEKDEGVRSFGTPLGTENERLKEAQSTDSSQ